eukprot:20408-Heterococcus_DN1.PRE.1
MDSDTHVTNDSEDDSTSATAMMDVDVDTTNGVGMSNSAGAANIIPASGGILVPTTSSAAASIGLQYDNMPVQALSAIDGDTNDQELNSNPKDSEALAGLSSDTSASTSQSPVSSSSLQPHGLNSTPLNNSIDSD